MEMTRYARIPDKNPREIVLLRGSGCKWRRCRFCDYHLDFSQDSTQNAQLNRQVLEKVTGEFGRLEIINSGSFVDLDTQTMTLIEQVCAQKQIHVLHFECHWRDRAAIPALRTRLQNIKVILKIGVESFDMEFREKVLDKGIDEAQPERLAQDFDECCLLVGITGQTAQSMRQDIEIGLRYFDRVCVNVMTPNTAPLQPDAAVCACFAQEIAPEYTANPRVDILMENTDFGVGEKQ